MGCLESNPGPSWICPLQGKRPVAVLSFRFPQYHFMLHSLAPCTDFFSQIAFLCHLFNLSGSRQIILHITSRVFYKQFHWVASLINSFTSVKREEESRKKGMKERMNKESKKAKERKLRNIGLDTCR